MAARRKAAAVDAPSTTEDAVKLIGNYAEAEHHATKVHAEAEEKIAAIKAERDSVLALLDEAQKLRFNRLKAWWSVASETLTDGKRKSVELAGALIGERTTNPKLKLPKGMTEQRAVDLLLEWLGGDYVRTVNQLDKPAILARLKDVPQGGEDPLVLQEFRVLADEVGASISQKEEFFISVAPLEGTETVAEADA